MGWLGAAAAVAILGEADVARAGTAASARALQPAQSYSELGDPAPDAVEIFHADGQPALPHSQAVDLRVMTQFVGPRPHDAPRHLHYHH